MQNIDFMSPLKKTNTNFINIALNFDYSLSCEILKQFFGCSSGRLHHSVISYELHRFIDLPPFSDVITMPLMYELNANQQNSQ